MAVAETDVRAHARWFGTPVKRKEDPRLLTGRGHYVADISLPRTVHCALLRSPHAHARINRIDVSKAKTLPGVGRAGGEQAGPDEAPRRAVGLPLS